VPDLSPLGRFVEEGALARYAEAHGLPLWASGSRVALDLALDVVSFDMETDVYPNGADYKLRRLAHASPALAGVLFDEIPHTMEDDRTSPEMLDDRYRFRAYADGLVWEVIGGDTSDWIDVPAVVGLLNAVLAHKKADERFFVLSCDGQDARILCAPREGVARAAADGVLRVDQMCDIT
jgi:hypothetical protein